MRGAAATPRMHSSFEVRMFGRQGLYNEPVVSARLVPSWELPEEAGSNLRGIHLNGGVIPLSLLGSGLASAQDAPETPPMTLFPASGGSGAGADLGGMAGANAHCQMLADGRGAGDHTWRTCLSTQGPGAVNARDRIGAGPWHNARGVLVGQNIDEIHGMGHQFTSMTMLDQQGRIIPGGGYAPNLHDVLTGSQPDGMAFPAGDDMTCGN